MFFNVLIECVMNVDLLPLISVSAVWSGSAFGLNLPIQPAGQFVLGVIVPIPPHTQNTTINRNSIYTYISLPVLLSAPRIQSLP